MSNSLRVGPAHVLGISVGDVCSFYRDNWVRRIALGISSFYDWQFIKPPENDNRDWNCIAVRDGQILGVMGLNQRTFFLEGNPLKGAELTTWVVSEAARGLGIGKAILQKLQESYDFIAGFGISEMALPIYMQFGFRRLSRLPRYFRIYDQETVDSFTRTDELGKRLASVWRWSKPRIFKVTSVNAEALSEIAALYRLDANLFTRDAVSLAWRYELHPVFNYQLFLVHDGSKPGYGAAVVLRQDETGGAKFLHVVDIFGDKIDLDAAIAFADAFAQDVNCAFADAYACRSAIGASFLASNWFSTNDDDCFQIAHLFYPVELRQPQTTSAVIWARCSRATAFDFGRLHLVKGDLDLDRPTIEYYKTHKIPMN